MPTRAAPSSARPMTLPASPVRVGVIGCGSVLFGPYRPEIQDLAAAGRARLVVACDVRPEVEGAVRAAFPVERFTTRPDGGPGRDRRRRRDGPDAAGGPRRARDGGSRGREARAGREAHGPRPGVGAADGRGGAGGRPPPGLRAVRDAQRDAPPDRRRSSTPGRSAASSASAPPPARPGRPGAAGSTRARGADRSFDLGVYSLTSMIDLVGPVRRVTAVSGIAVPERVVDGEPMRPTLEDSFQVALDFGGGTLGVLTTGFTMADAADPGVRAVRQRGDHPDAGGRLGARRLRPVAKRRRSLGARAGVRPRLELRRRAATPRGAPGRRRPPGRCRPSSRSTSSR